MFQKALKLVGTTMRNSRNNTENVSIYTFCYNHPSTFRGAFEAALI